MNTSTCRNPKSDKPIRDYRFAVALGREEGFDALRGREVVDLPTLDPSSINRLAWSRIQVRPYSKLVSSGAPIR
jgi:hypothetical protein